MSLASKLAEVMAAVERVKKNGKNNFHGYEYVTESDLVEAVRGELAKRKIVLSPNCVDHAMRDMPPTAKGKAQFLTTVMMEFTFYDGESEERITFRIPGAGIDGEDKGTYKAMTGAEKYALMKFFLVATGDDPERDDKRRDKDEREAKAKDDFLKCQETDCGRKITPVHNAETGMKRSVGEILEAGRKRWNLDLCAGCQIARHKKEKDAVPEPAEPDYAEMDNGEIQAVGTVTQVTFAKANKPLTFRMKSRMFSCWHKSLWTHIKVGANLAISCKKSGDFVTVEKILAIDGVGWEDLTIQEAEIA